MENKSIAERIAVLEFAQQQSTAKLDSIEEKLDSLLALKHKGLGAFWLASTLIGIAITAIIEIFFGWRHHG